MNQVFNQTTTAQIDAKLHYDILAHEDNIEKICIIIYFIFLLLFKGWIDMKIVLIFVNNSQEFLKFLNSFADNIFVIRSLME